MSERAGSRKCADIDSTHCRTELGGATKNKRFLPEGVGDIDGVAVK